MKRILPIVLVSFLVGASCQKERPEEPEAQNKSRASSAQSTTDLTSQIDAEGGSGVAAAAPTQSVRSLSAYSVLERKMLNDALVISVQASDLSVAQEIAEELIAEEHNRRMIRVFLYSPEQVPNSDVPLIRYEWTPARGLVLSYDNRLPPPQDELDPTLPQYEILFRVRQVHNGRVYADVLVPGLSRAIPADARERIARAICRQENIADIVLYSTPDAYEANNSASYSRDHPEAMNGLLGILENGEFKAGEMLFP